MPFYVGATRPGAVGWTRILLTLVMGAVLVVLLLVRPLTPGPLMPVMAALLFVGYALWTWMRLATRFIVDGHGVTVSWGGMLPQPVWPLEEMRTVQLREIPAETLGVTVGGVGWRRGRVMSGDPGERRPVGDRRVWTTGHTQDPYVSLVTRPGTAVEIMGRENRHFLITPVDVDATAAAIDQALRARR
ncbi:hypothetical protein JSY14_11005 [Brachybacterium sp. EF45031]|nr:hypothetical protein [Brachybacterium sillae]